MSKLTKKAKEDAKQKFAQEFEVFVESLQSYISYENGDWTIKGFIDIYRNLYTISADTKIVSKILEIHLFPKILQFAKQQRYSIVLAEHQNWYPDMSFVSQDDARIKFAVDIKTTYRDPDFPGHVNGFTLGSHGAYFKDRSSTKNIQFPYEQYVSHYCLGIIYSRSDIMNENETRIVRVNELETKGKPAATARESNAVVVNNLKSITSVINNFKFFLCEKWRLASDKQGSGNTANIGSITYIEDIVQGNGVFSRLGEDWFDEYWMNYGIAMKRKGRAVKVSNLAKFIDFKGKKTDKKLIVAAKTKRKIKK